MGLDMYLEGEKYLSINSRDPQARPREDGYEVKAKVLRLGYWRKHPDLHGYIVNTFARGIDNCGAIPLSDADIERVIDAVADDQLPHTEGFFFGATDGTEKEETLKLFTAALAWLRTADASHYRTVYYRASW